MIDNYKNAGLVRPHSVSDGTPAKTAAEIIQEEMSANDPITNAKSDVFHYMDAGISPEIIISLIMVRNTGLRQFDAVRIVNEIAGTKIDSANYVFKITAADMEIGDAPITERRDPRAERLLAGRRDAERYLAHTDIALAAVTQAIILRNGITLSEAQTIVDDLTNKPI